MDRQLHFKTEMTDLKVTDIHNGMMGEHGREAFVISPDRKVSYISASAAALLGIEVEGLLRDSERIDARDLINVGRGVGESTKSVEVKSALGIIPAVSTLHFTGERVVWLLPELCHIAADGSYSTVMRRLCRIFRGIPQLIDRAIREKPSSLSERGQYGCAELIAGICRAPSCVRSERYSVKKRADGENVAEKCVEEEAGSAGARRLIKYGVNSALRGSDSDLSLRGLREREENPDPSPCIKENTAAHRKCDISFRILSASSPLRRYERLVSGIMKWFNESYAERACREGLSPERFFSVLMSSISACIRLSPYKNASMWIEETHRELVLVFDCVRDKPDSDLSWAVSEMLLKALGAEGAVESVGGRNCLRVRLLKSGAYATDIHRPKKLWVFRRRKRGALYCREERRYLSPAEYLRFLGGFYADAVDGADRSMKLRAGKVQRRRRCFAITERGK